MKPWSSTLVFVLLLGMAACSRSVPGLPPTEPVPTAATPTVLFTLTPTGTPRPVPTAVPAASPTPDSTTASIALRSFSMVDARIGWGAGNNAVLRTTDGGQSWSVVTPAGAELNSGDVPQVFAGDASTAWLLVPDPADFHRGMLFRTRDGGKTWQSAPVPFGGAAVQFLTPERVFLMASRGVAAGSQAVDIYTSGDGGVVWTLLCSVDPQQTGERCLPFGGNKDGLTFRDPTHGWVGGFMPVEGVTYLFVSTDGGKTWQQTQLALPAGFEQAQMDVTPPEFFGSQNGVLVVRAILPQDVGSVAAQIFFRTRDGGQSWQAAAPLRSVGLVALATAEDWVVWDGGELAATHDGGQTWQSVKPDVDLSEKLTALQFIDANIGWALALEEENTRLYRTTDGGHTWQ